MCLAQLIYNTRRTRRGRGFESEKVAKKERERRSMKWRGSSHNRNYDMQEKNPGYTRSAVHCQYNARLQRLGREGLVPELTKKPRGDARLSHHTHRPDTTGDYMVLKG